ncbi:MAG: hypothetical protein QG592_2014 [Pseudomonadota bacterium]|nr:hypothetical protein [Pseudomonadota bacterium]
MSFDIKKPGDTSWAYKLRDKYLQGERLLPIQIFYASAALGEVWAQGQCRKDEAA